MKNYNAKTEIMKIFEAFPNMELSSQRIYEIAREMGIFIPPAFNTHLSQLMKRGDIERTCRGVYMLDTNHCSCRAELGNSWNGICKDCM